MKLFCARLHREEKSETYKPNSVYHLNGMHFLKRQNVLHCTAVIAAAYRKQLNIFFECVGKYQEILQEITSHRVQRQIYRVLILSCSWKIATSNRASTQYHSQNITILLLPPNRRCYLQKSGSGHGVKIEKIYTWKMGLRLRIL